MKKATRNFYSFLRPYFSRLHHSKSYRPPIKRAQKLKRIQKSEKKGVTANGFKSFFNSEKKTSEIAKIAMENITSPNAGQSPKIRN